MPFPNHESFNPEAAALDKLTVADRIAQIQSELSPQEYSILKGWLLLCSGSTLDTMSFYEFIHWWALCNHSYEGCIEYLIKYKFHGGQSSFAIKFWEEAVSTKKLSYTFNCPVISVEDSGRGVTVTAKDGRQFCASKVISTIPLNVLDTVKFSPALDPQRTHAIRTKHINQCVKVHAEVQGAHLRSWSSIDPDSKLIYAFGDGRLPNGNTHIVAFGANETHLDPEKDVDATKKILTDAEEMDIKRLVSPPTSSIFLFFVLLLTYILMHTCTLRNTQD